MKRRNVFILLPLVIAATLWLQTACKLQIDQAGPYGSAGQFGTNDNSFLLLSDKALGDSKDVFSAFLLWEMQNRQTLATMGAQNVTKVADTIRGEAPLWFTNAYNARQLYVSIYKSNPAGSGAASNAFAAAVSQIQAQALASSTLTNTIKK